MRNRGYLGIAVALALALLLTTPVQAAAPKAGAKCTKKNSTATSSGKVFTCMQSGKKLVWSKGILIKKVLPAASISEPTPTPTPSPTPTYNRQNWELVYLKIWDELNAAQNLGKFPFEYKLSPNVNKARAQESIAAYDKAMKLWLAVLNGAKVSPVIWSIMSEKDYTWWRQVVDAQEGSTASYAWDPNTNTLGHCNLSSFAFCGYGQTFKSNTPDYKFLQYNVIGSEYMGSPNANTVNHESVHFYQLSVVQSFPRDLPCWYVEGQASLYGGALEWNLNTERNSSIRQRNNFKGIVRQYQPSADSFTATEWKSVLQNMYPPHISCSGQQDYFKYAMGMFIWEHLYEKYGPKTMHQILLDFKDGKLWSEASQKHLALTVGQLDDQLALHLENVFAGKN